MFGVSSQCNSRPKARDVLLTWARARAYEDRAVEYLKLADVAPDNNIRNRFVAIAGHYRTLAQLERRAVDETASPSHQSQETIVCRSGRLTSFALVLLTIISGAMVLGPFDFARADNCLAAPNSTAPNGSHWYYHLNRATQQKCWYVRSSEKEPPYPTVQTTSVNGAMPSTSARHGSAGANHGSSHQLEASIDALQDPVSNTMPNGSPSQRSPPESTQAVPVLRDNALSNGNGQPTVATAVVWPDPPPIVQIAPSVNAGKAIAATEPDNQTVAVSDTTESVAKNGGQTSKFEIPVATFPALAIGLVVIGFGVRFLVKNSAARSVQTIDHTEAVTIIPDDDHIKSSHNRSADDETANFGEDDFGSFASAVSGGEPLRKVGSVHPTISAREARLAKLFDDVHQRLGWDGSTQHRPKQKVVC
jgi:hypothetical protein